MLKRSLEALRAKAVFFRRYNDVDVYIEDSSVEAKKLFATLLSRVGQGTLQIQCVFPLGGKHEVIKACLADERPGGRPRLYVVDGDFDGVCSSLIARPRLYVLRRYCVENYLIDAEASVAVLEASSTTLDRRTASGKLAFDDWLRRIAEPLRQLYIVFIIARMLLPAVRTVATPVRELVSDDSGLVDAAKCAAKVAELEARLSVEVGVAELAWWRAFVVARCSNDPVEFLLTHVSGKDVLLPLLRMRMNRVERSTKPVALLKIELAARCSPTDLRDALGQAS